MVETYVVGIAVLATVAVLVGPVLANRQFRSARQPTDAERDRIDSLRSWAQLDVDVVYVIDTVGEHSVDVAVRGPPGRRFLFVTDYVLEELDEEIAAALFAAEAGRADTYYGLVRAVAVGVVLGLLAATFALLVPFGPGIVLIGAIGLFVFWVGRQLQYRADEIAARRVGADVVADAFERVAELNGVEPERGTWKTIFEIQPPLGDRIARLRAEE